MTAPAVRLEGRCARCPGRIEYLGGVSWRHIGRPGGTPHAADPNQATRDKLKEVAA
ncbi:hypothetical protein [Actinoplanes rectilineatus]|uniref:hypothetical protein n=1 Tax=Actinoplanes rectilineatus TaxID=113571 RepID=UPI000A9FB9D4|nr:hypothetical protein [Actinoplanes rectilineatus]